MNDLIPTEIHSRPLLEIKTLGAGLIDCLGPSAYVLAWVEEWGQWVGRFVLSLKLPFLQNKMQ